MTPVQILEAVGQEMEATGYAVWFQDGWKTRSVGGAFEPAGLVCHHTGTNRNAPGDYPSLGIVRDGVDQGGGYFLPGPLAQLGLGRSGTVYVIAAGKANHAGPGGWDGLSGNFSVWGIEAENDGIGEPWPPEQVEAYLALATALARHTGFDAGRVCRHAEWSTAGKIDPATAPMNDGDWIRSQVAARLRSQPQPSQEDDEMFTYSTAPDVDGGSIWFVVSGTAHRLHLPADADRINKAGVLSLGEMSASFHGVFDHRG